MTETVAKKNTQKLQRAIVDGLEDVKAQDIVVFNTEHLSPLFERVVVASGTSNRQTKALAASVRDAVREAGFDKPRVEGEENGEWIIVDCGQAVVHVMQPAIRQYYNLEEIWGDKPVRLKLGAPKPVVKVDGKAANKLARKTTKSTVTALAPTRKAKPEAAVKAASRKTPASSGAAAVVKKASKPAAKKVAAPTKKTASPKSVATVVVKPPKSVTRAKAVPASAAKKTTKPPTARKSAA